MCSQIFVVKCIAYFLNKISLKKAGENPSLYLTIANIHRNILRLFHLLLVTLLENVEKSLIKQIICFKQETKVTYLCFPKEHWKLLKQQTILLGCRKSKNYWLKFTRKVYMKNETNLIVYLQKKRTCKRKICNMYIAITPIFFFFHVHIVVRNDNTTAGFFFIIFYKRLVNVISNLT